MGNKTFKITETMKNKPVPNEIDPDDQANVALQGKIMDITPFTMEMYQEDVRLFKSLGASNIPEIDQLLDEMREYYGKELKKNKP